MKKNCVKKKLQLSLCQDFQRILYQKNWRISLYKNPCTEVSGGKKHVYSVFYKFSSVPSAFSGTAPAVGAGARLSASRIFASISAATSGLSSKYFLAFVLP